jgi:hypothetical protein
MSRSRRTKDVSGTVISSYDRESKAIDFPRAWAEAREYDSSLSPSPPKDLPDEVQRVIILLTKRVLKLESEWS